MISKKIPGTFVEAAIGGQWIRFFVHNPNDVIQRHHLAGEFYEPEELALMSRYMTADSRYLDIGANVGNHVVYLNKFIGLKNIVVIEPNAPAMALLRLNLLLNGIEQVVDVSCLGYGLSDRAGRADMVTLDFNLGQARFVEDPNGPFELRTGDELLGARDFDFIKIDVEGMELKCLDGLTRLIARCRPILFVEVENTNELAFREWCVAQRYDIRERFRRYTTSENCLAIPA